ncbi:hypothetical protein SI65_07197 [Aspergillus cristatus]|uniref:Nephrocystin 3-like N-terminal domain-containing protein n=1 Tax=Aspergillus cristatus TaxID=573508 RepID=A0A1E3B981_ASPCR|nr:hypothetical protein SI65_07197 [Aspergillus cristatus]
MECVYRTLASRALGIYQSRNNDKCASKRVIIALSGPPGSGKSTIASAVVTHLNSQTTEPLAITLPMDGFHYPKAYLNSLPNREEAYARRGARWTFNAACKTDVQKEALYAPQFDHAVGDPVENGTCVSPDISIIMLEANYLSCNIAPWSEIVDYVDDTWFVDVDMEIAKQRVARRHLASGIESTWVDAVRRAENNDLPNGMDIRTHLIKPAVVVQSGDDSKN